MTKAVARRVARRYGAVAIAVVLVVPVTVAEGRHDAVFGAAGGAGIAFLLLGLTLRVPRLVLVAVVLIGATFALADGFGSIARAAALPYGIGLFLLSELGISSAAGRPSRSTGVVGVDHARVGYLALVTGAALTAGLVALAAAGSLHGGMLLELGGLVVACALIVAVVVARGTESAGRTQ